MPSFAELMFQQASDSAKQGIGDIAGASASGTKMGAEIAQHIEQAQQQRKELEIKKQDLELAKIQHYVNAVQVGGNMPEGPARNDYLKNRLPSLAGSLGIDKSIPPQSQSFFQKDPHIAGALQEKVKNQELDPAAAISIAADPDQLAKFAGSDDYKKYVAMKKLDQPGDVTAATAAAQRASPPSDTQVTAAKNALVSRLQRNGMTGGISYADLQAAQNDPAKMQSFLQSTGLDKLGGEAAFNQVMETYPKALSEADAKGTADERALKVAAMRVSPIEDRTAQGVHQKAIDAVSSPTSVVQRKLGAYQSIDNALASFKASGGMSQEFEQLQTQLRLNQGATGGKTGVDERANAHASDLGITKDQYVQIATGNVQNVNLSSPKLVKAIQDVATTELAQIKSQAAQQMKTNANQHKSFYKTHPDLKDDYENTSSSILDQFNTTQTGEKTYMVRGKPVSATILMKLSPAAKALLPPDVKQELGIK
jgi:hypothetical protein